MNKRAVLAAALLLAGCGQAPAPNEPRTRSGFPKAARIVAPVVSPAWSTERARDDRREADAVMEAAGVKPGMTVADIGAGEGYYTIRLAARVGPTGRVLAEDIVPAYRDRLAERIYRERLDNVSVRLGKVVDPQLPDNSFDRVFLVHMYHEIDQPYEFLWQVRPSLRRGGMVVVVDADRPTAQHGTPPSLLDCEFASAGYRLIRRTDMPQAGGYLALYAPHGARPEPRAMRACHA
ncbi:methyltransferase domain-containing protein [uncultured Sphingomonas sp.]|uniref:class I SAM-dependent methyltransferase n=1 Tax=uncultured Sphingomonas sp. TaxID=158754 RepID=UPI0025E92632|nr:methyltransferase domain-containing protein [uncultured Sphingomonas sp.]